MMLPSALCSRTRGVPIDRDATAVFMYQNVVKLGQ